MELYHGSPENLSGRSDREIRTYRFLDELGIDFDRTDHPDQPATSMEVCAEVDEILNVHICKNLFLCNRQKTAFYLCVNTSSLRLKTGDVFGKFLKAVGHDYRTVVLTDGNPGPEKRKNNDQNDSA